MIKLEISDDPIYELPINCINAITLKNDYPDEYLYFYIHSFYSNKDKVSENYHKVFEIYLQNIDQYKKLIESLSDEESNTGIKQVFKTSYNTICNNRSRIFINSHKNILDSLENDKYNNF